MRTRETPALVLLAALWGASFLFMRVAAPAVGPVMVAALRVTIAGAALLLSARTLGRAPRLRPTPAYLVLGALNAAIPYTLIAAAELRLTASLAAILNATTPLFGVLVAAAWLREGLTAGRAGGVLVGLAGVVVLVGWSPLPLDGRLAAATGASLAASLSYALAAVYAKTAFSDGAPLPLAVGQQAGAAALLVPLALPLGLTGVAPFDLSGGVMAAVAALGLLCTAVAYLLYFHLIATVGPTRTLSVTFLIPVFGVLWSALFLQEPVGSGMFAGLGLILAGVVLVLELPARPRRRRPAMPPVAASPTGCQEEGPAAP